jgi:glycosyltransferase involved in cell wall biosynthesis
MSESARIDKSEFKVVYFGTYTMKEGYTRNSVIKTAMESAGAQVIRCHRDTWGDTSSRTRDVTNIAVGIKRILRLTRAWFSLSWEYLTKVPDHDLVLVGYPGYLDVFIAKTLGWIRSKPVVLDAFMPIYEAVVEDRKLAHYLSLKARLLKFIDRASSWTADLVLMDTQAHINYYRDAIGTDIEKFVRVFVGAEENYFHPVDPPLGQIPGEVLFFGSFLPLHGADVIVETAGLLKDHSDIKFTMIGGGTEWQRCRNLAQASGAKITWKQEWINYSELADLISRAGVCLGIFSDDSKADRVIPCKVFNVIAVGKPLITADTVAAREALIHGKNAYLVPPGNPEALAKAILTLYNDKLLRDRIATGGHATFRDRFSSKALGNKLIGELKLRFATRIDPRNSIIN